MITIDGTQYRNLQEQVFKNQSDIANIILGGKLLGQLGIKVLGQYDTVDELYAAHPPQTYVGDYGDAYLVGIAEPYSFYIFTRPFQGESFPQWFNLGPFPVAGPAGPEGPEGQRGPEGPRGNTIHSGNVPPTVGGITDLKSGDYYLNTTTKILYKYEDGYFKAEVVLEGKQGPQGIQGPIGPQGPQGPQGIQGPIGEPGAAVIIVGKIPSVDGLPSPSEDIRNNAYIIPVDGVEHIFGITGTDTLMWTDLGPFGGGGSIVYANGAVQGTWDADTKLNKSPAAGVVYANNIFGDPVVVQYNTAVVSNTVVQRDDYGRIKCAAPSGTNVNDVATAGYVAQQITQIRDYIMGKVYPIDSVYISMTDSTNPGADSKLGFGTWERIENRLLYGISDSDTPGAVSGAWSHNHYLNNAYAALAVADLSGTNVGGNGILYKPKTNVSWTPDRGVKLNNTITYDPGITNATQGASIVGGTDYSTGKCAPVINCYIWQRTA